mmetsp:Transcript_46423/g.116377  ORF Transcript_46423/g.116377 Transcript_46423/m.116377 type:complete len:215 (-) Transcript_46423:184-828(-)
MSRYRQLLGLLGEKLLEPVAIIPAQDTIDAKVPIGDTHLQHGAHPPLHPHPHLRLGHLTHAARRTLHLLLLLSIVQHLHLHVRPRPRLAHNPGALHPGSRHACHHKRPYLDGLRRTSSLRGALLRWDLDGMSGRDLGGGSQAIEERCVERQQLLTAASIPLCNLDERVSLLTRVRSSLGKRHAQPSSMVLRTRPRTPVQKHHVCPDSPSSSQSL